MKGVLEALDIVLSHVKPVSYEKVFLFDALDRISGENIISPVDLPPYDNSAMDGFAILSSDTRGASGEKPVFLKIKGEIKAGDDASSMVLTSGSAFKIMTGGMMPKGADAVVEVEQVKVEGDKVCIFQEVETGRNVRKRGESVKKGEMIIKKGDVLTPGRIGLASSIGRSYLSVYRKPKVGLIVTGDEVFEVDEEPSPGGIRNSNSYTLYTLIKRAGGDPINFGVVKDDPKDIEKAISEAIGICDILLTTGGVSMGDYDFVKDILGKVGIDLVFWKVAMKPGKPLVFGVKGEKLFFGLPGNPVSCMVSFEIFVKPSLRKMMGESKIFNPVFTAYLDEDVPYQRDGRYHFARVTVRKENNKFYVSTTGPQGSGILKSMAIGEGFIVIPPGDGYLKKGSPVPLIIFEERVLRSESLRLS